jgi:cyclic pyranopterin phosphate synthase
LQCAGAQLEELVRFAAHQGSELRFIELMPLGPGAARHDEEFLSAAEALDLLGRGGAPERALPSSSTAERHLFRRDGLPVVVGFIPSVTRPFCGACDRLRLDSRGRLRACLRGERQLDLVGLQAEGAAALEAAVRELAARKRSPQDVWPDLSMTRIGG